MNKTDSLAKEIGLLLQKQGSTIVTAESCTGGGLSYALTRIPGSSGWFDRAYVTYSNRAKTQMLEIPHSLIEQHGAVSQEVVNEMAKNALRLSQATWSIAITGIAGPEGGTPEYPVGSVWIAWMNQTNIQKSELYHFKGDRSDIREQSINTALSVLQAALLR